MTDDTTGDEINGEDLDLTDDDTDTGVAPADPSEGDDDGPQFDEPSDEEQDGPEGDED